jgi:hypothetical protein
MSFGTARHTPGPEYPHPIGLGLSPVWGIAYGLGPGVCRILDMDFREFALERLSGKSG